MHNHAFKSKSVAVLTAAALLFQMGLSVASAVTPAKKVATIKTNALAVTTPAKTTSATNATNNTQWTWKVDGVTSKSNVKATATAGSDMLVSLKELAKALGIPLFIDTKTKTIYLGKLPAELNPVATYKVGKVTKKVTEKQMNDYIAYRIFLNANLEQYKNETDFQKDMIKYIVLNDWATSQASPELIASSKKFATETVNQWLESMKTNETMRASWNALGIPRSTIEQFLISNKTAFEREKMLVTDGDLEKAYATASKSGDFTLVDVRHILIQTTNPSTGEQLRTNEEALTKIKEIQDRLKKGEAFADVAKSASEDPGSASNGGLYSNAAIKNFVSAFKKACNEQELNVIGEPVETEYGYHIILVEKRTLQPLDDVKDTFRNQVTEDRLNKLFDDNLKGILINLALPKNSFQVK